MSDPVPDDPALEVIDQRTGKAADMSVLEEAGVAFDPTTMHLDLTKDEKRRTTAIMLAMQAYKELIIKEADYLVAAADLARRDEGPKLQSATIDAMVDAAVKFDMFIATGTTTSSEETTRGGMTTETSAADESGRADE